MQIIKPAPETSLEDQVYQKLVYFSTCKALHSSSDVIQTFRLQTKGHFHPAEGASPLGF